MGEVTPPLGEDKFKALIKAVNDAFGEGKITGMLFFEHHPDGWVKYMSPVFGDLKSLSADPRPGETIKRIVQRLLDYSRATKSMAEDMINRVMPKN